MNRRSFFKTVAVGAAASAVLTPAAQAANESRRVGSIIDLTLCDGCAHQNTPECVLACRNKNQVNYPQPDPAYLQDYWPQKKHEDWSDNPERTDRLTPYNWIYVEKVEIPGQNPVFVPRRCMHCVDAPCQKLCPFGVIGKSDEGAVQIDTGFCMGGGKCREVCPWHIPQRQAGVGLYTKLAPKLAGGGVMYKCDLCADLLTNNQKPACESACPKKAVLFGPLEAMKTEAARRAEMIGGHVYGLEEGGGTATFYVSKTPFEVIDRAIALAKTQTGDKEPGRPQMPVGIANPLKSAEGMFLAGVIAPLAGVAAAGIAFYKSRKKEEAGHEG